MNINEIEELLGRYYEGETTLEEEKQLKDFFLQDDIPENLRQHQPLFRFFIAEANETLSEENQDASLNRKIEQYLGETSTLRVHPGKKRLYYMSAMAAGLVLLIGLVFLIKNEAGRKGYIENTQPSTELAYNQTRQALMMVSVGLNTGLDEVQRLKTLENALGQIQRINKFYNYQTQFINPERMQDPSTNK
ncbi:MAG: hypothetical protein NTW31_06715 [Bacteroidetes bacterium]|nr:hypothetical protein [Bacteroidota bacterium]